MRVCTVAMMLLLLVVSDARSDEDTKALTKAVNDLKNTVAKSGAAKSGEAGWWAPLLGPIAGGIVGLTSSALTQLALYYICRRKRPVLQVTVDSQRGGLAESPDGNKYVRLKIMNTGKENATECRAVLTGIEKLEGASWKSIAYHDAVELVWAYGWKDAITEKNIVPGVEYFVDVCCAFCGTNKIAIRALEISSKYHNMINSNGHYVYKVLVVSQNADPVPASVRINWSGNAEHLTIESV